MSEQVDVGLTWMGEDMIACVEYRVTSFGCRGARYMHPNDPDRDDPQYEIEGITLRRDLPSEIDERGQRYYPRAPEFEATGALLWELANNEEIDAAVYQEVCEEAEEQFYARTRRRSWR